MFQSTQAKFTTQSMIIFIITCIII